MVPFNALQIGTVISDAHSNPSFRPANVPRAHLVLQARYLYNVGWTNASRRSLWFASNDGTFAPGCRLYIMSDTRCRVHPACYDAELEAEFFQLQDWKWYADNETRHELSLQYIRQTGGSNPLFVSKQYHRQHCAYTWMKLHRSIIRGVPIDSHMGAYKHTVHCGRALAASSADLPIGSKFNEIFTHCEMPEKCMFILLRN